MKPICDIVSNFETMTETIKKIFLHSDIDEKEERKHSCHEAAKRINKKED